jgi:parallel beta-helix repeat protein
MKTFTSQIQRHTQIRRSFCSRILVLVTTTFALVFVMSSLGQAASAGTKIINLDCEDLIRPMHPIVSGEYFLKEDCQVGLNMTAIQITADKVHLNMGGHTIAGPIRTPSECETATADFHGINVTGSNVHINNGTVIGFFRGINLANGHDNHVNNLTVTSNCEAGILVASSHNNHINGNNASGNFGRGVLLISANNNRVNSNVVNNNDNTGIDLETSQSNRIESNQVLVNILRGINLRSGSNNNLILDNKVYGTITVGGNNAFGINTSGIDPNPPSINNFIQGNTAKFTLGGNDLSDFNIINPVNPVCDNTWTSNIFTTTSPPDAVCFGTPTP